MGAKDGFQDEFQSLFNFQKKCKRGKTPVSKRECCAWKQCLPCLAYCYQGVDQ